MSIIESIGVCPNCNNKSIIRYTNDHLGFEFDACPSCTYLFDGCSNSDHTAWFSILSAYDVKSIEQLEDQIKNIKVSAGGRKQVFMTPSNMEKYIYTKPLINDGLQGWIDSQNTTKERPNVVASTYTGSLDLILRNHAKTHGTALIRELFNTTEDNALKFVDGVYGISINDTHTDGNIQLTDLTHEPF